MKTCALVGAADFNAADFVARREAGAFDFVIAVDAGFAHLEGIGVAPDMAVGLSLIHISEPTRRS